MRDYTQARTRVQTTRLIRGYYNIPAGWQGTIECVQDDGLGRRLVEVVWDANGKRWPVFPEEIEPI